ncbi:ATP-dependent DNA helicase RecG [Nocardioides baekrokdamisoli]|uniref:ATP-dependent DNA helicase RecG n=1 Tax=Nocardioides baekrokdamisoli TaxID=1804624 RepID=A0A3G9J3I1_9ACTN|nr:ATP-dependent DNA helicase RecG [Nocardioides baekrokdamisoli]BBH18188.1 ATP-dependent DNA helicase RecG [Nocardioides baekrokdamisoli]
MVGEITPDSPIEAVLGASKKADRFTAGLGLRTVRDLLDHVPRRYLDTAKLTDIDDLREGVLLTVVGEVATSRVAQYTDRRTGRAAARLDVTVRTGGPSMRMTFFAKSPRVTQWQAQRLAPETKGIFVGKLGSFRGEWQLTNPQMVLFGDPGQGAEDTSMAIEELTDLFPIYPLTAGLESWDVMRATRFARTVVTDLDDPIPHELREEHKLIELRTAYDWIHAPKTWAQKGAAEKRFKFGEALVLQLVLGRRRQAIQAQNAQARTGGGTLLGEFDAQLPYDLTAGQRVVGEEIEADLARSYPMNRLLQGDVGTGKTLVALRAMLRVVDSGGQAVLLAPTEVLAQQHLRSITAILGDLGQGALFGGGTTVDLLTGSMTKSQRAGVLSRLVTGETGIVVGTHALLEDNVMFDDLGLVVVDEQHRFGVEQRAALTDKAGTPPHLLVMTATPIPRTVAMTVFGDLDVSTLTELPAGRAPIQTNVVPLAEQSAWWDRVWARVREEVDKGHQAYVVVSRIAGDVAEADPGDLPEDEATVPPRGVDELLEELASGPLAGLRLAPLHGRLPSDVKERTMSDFAAGQVDVVVATTVIEVGVDVANATMMVVIDADRFGISQLHQLRGRVGRGGLPGLCLLVTNTPAETPGRERLAAVASTTDGFELARVDLEQRREGDVLGATQSGGRSSLQALRVLRDESTIVEARGAAERLLEGEPLETVAPGLAEVVRQIEHSTRADYLEKS